MNDSAKRREELLRHSKKTYHENPIVPAIHPDHRALYNDLYQNRHFSSDETFFDDRNSNRSEGSLFLRFSAAILIFVCFVWFDSYDKSILETDSTDIIMMIEHQTDVEELAEVWNEL